ncbi:unnamed protein product, partial [Durusdinium trenchii]
MSAEANHGSADEVACAKRRRSDVWPTATRAADAIGGRGAAGGCISGIHLVSMRLWQRPNRLHDCTYTHLGTTHMDICRRVRALELQPETVLFRTGGKNTIIVQDSTTQANRALGSTLTVTFDRPHQSQGPLAFPAQIEMEELVGRRMDLAAN